MTKIKYQKQNILQRLTKLHPKLIDLSLDRIIQLLEKLGNPHEKLHNSINVVGTNGKGSVCENIRSILTYHGKTVNTYTSPHLVRFNERIRIGKNYISEKKLEAILNEVEEINAGKPITFFEITTAAAMLAFAKYPAHYNIFECGMGGRLDATNVIQKPVATVITTIDKDHMEFLGKNIEDIAAEKAAIIKYNVPVISAYQTKKVAQIIIKNAEKLNAPVYFYKKNFFVKKKSENNYLFIDDGKLKYQIPKPKLVGTHQIENTAIAIKTTSIINNNKYIQEQIIIKAITNTNWPARLQKLRKGKIHKILPEKSEIWIDGAHNVNAAKSIAKNLQKYIIKPQYETILLWGMSENKPAKEFLKNFDQCFKNIITIKIPNVDVAYEAKELQKIAKSLGFYAYEADNIENAILKAAEISQNKKLQLFVIGSLYLAAEIIKYQQLK